jgi:hypothetical protein
MFLENLGDSSMRLGVPFIAPRQLGAVAGQQRRLSLPSVGWRIGQSGAPPTVALAIVGSPDSPVHHRRVQRIIAVRRRFFPRVACSLEASMAHQTLSGAPPDSPVCQTELGFCCTEPSLFGSFLLFFSLFLVFR